MNRIIISFGNMTIALSHILRIPVKGIGFTNNQLRAILPEKQGILT